MNAIIFDLDGVIVHSELPRFKEIQKLSSSLGVDLEDDLLHEMAGVTTNNFLQKVVGERFSMEQIMHIIKAIETEYKPNLHQHVEPIKETIFFITNYSGPLDLAIGSMSTKQVIVNILTRFNILDKFKVIVSRDDVTFHKPHPEVYVKACEKLGYVPSDCVVVEDTPIGAQAAISAGCRCYVLLNGINKKEQFNGLKIDRFLDKDIII